MFSKWLLILCSLLFVCSPGTSTGATTSGLGVEDVCKAGKIVQADTQYGWQVSGSFVSAYDVPAN